MRSGHLRTGKPYDDGHTRKSWSYWFMAMMRRRREDGEPIEIEWVYEDHWSGETARWAKGRITATVRDLDGDCAEYEVRVDGEKFVFGKCWDFRSFETATACAELGIRAALHDLPLREPR